MTRLLNLRISLEVSGSQSFAAQRRQTVTLKSDLVFFINQQVFELGNTLSTTIYATGMIY